MRKIKQISSWIGWIKLLPLPPLDPLFLVRSCGGRLMFLALCSFMGEVRVVKCPFRSIKYSFIALYYMKIRITEGWDVLLFIPEIPLFHSNIVGHAMLCMTRTLLMQPQLMNFSILWQCSNQYNSWVWFAERSAHWLVNNYGVQNNYRHEYIAHKSRSLIFIRNEVMGNNQLMSKEC